MQSKNKKAPTVAEADYIRLVSLQPCSVCDEGGGEGQKSEVHEIEQGALAITIRRVFLASRRAA